MESSNEKHQRGPPLLLWILLVRSHARLKKKRQSESQIRLDKQRGLRKRGALGQNNGDAGQRVLSDTRGRKGKTSDGWNN